MRIESIEIHNYRQYKNLSLTFPKRTDFDLHVIIGANGVGKTNLLNALNWCFYDDEPHYVGSKDEKLPIANLKALSEAKEEGKNTVNVSVAITLSTNDETIEVRRECDVIVSSRFQQKSVLSVSVKGKEGNTDYLLGDEMKYKIEELVPEGLRAFFFFDGEQLVHYFGKNGDNVKESIYEIAQINVVTNAKRHMQEVADSTSREIEKANPDVGKYDAERKQKLEQIDSIKQNISDLEDTIERAEERLSELQQSISSQEHRYNDIQTVNKNDKRLESLADDRKAVISELCALVRKYYVLLAFYRMNKKANDMIQEKSEGGKLPPPIELELLKKTLNNNICQVCGQGIDKDPDAQAHINELIKRIELSTTASSLLAVMKNDMTNAVEEARNYSKERENTYAKLEKIDAEIKALTEENDKLRKRIGNISSTDNISADFAERDKLRLDVKNNREKIGRHKEQQKIAEAEYQKANQAYTKAIEDTKTVEQLRRKHQFATNAILILKQIENEIIDDARTSMEEKTKAHFGNLIWKQNTFGRIEFDDRFKLHVYHKETDDPCIGSASAAEMEALALAFTLALHEVSGHDAPIFIDTPVARVSDKNLSRFGETLVPASMNKQLILAFTPKEFSNEIQQKLRPEVLSTCITITNDESITTASEVYEYGN